MEQSLLSAVVDIPACLAWFPSTGEWIIILAFGLLLFGKRLPEVGRSLGKGIVEFKKGLKGVEDDIEVASEPKPLESKTTEAAHTALPAGAKFDPYTGKPLDEAQAAGNAAEAGKPA